MKVFESLPAWHPHAHVQGNGDLRRIGKDEFRFWEERLAAEIFSEEVPMIELVKILMISIHERTSLMGY